MGAETWALVSQIVPVILSWIIGDQKVRAEAEARFQGWISQHKADGGQSAVLTASYADQTSDLRARAAARDQALAKAHPAAQSAAPASVTPPQGKSPVPAVPLP